MAFLKSYKITPPRGFQKLFTAQTSETISRQGHPSSPSMSSFSVVCGQLALERVQPQSPVRVSPGLANYLPWQWPHRSPQPQTAIEKASFLRSQSLLPFRHNEVTWVFAIHHFTPLANICTNMNTHHVSWLEKGARGIKVKIRKLYKESCLLDAHSLAE